MKSKSSLRKPSNFNFSTLRIIEAVLPLTQRVDQVDVAEVQVQEYKIRRVQVKIQIRKEGKAIEINPTISE